MKVFFWFLGLGQSAKQTEQMTKGAMISCAGREEESPDNLHVRWYALGYCSAHI